MTRTGGGAPILIPIDSWANAAPAARRSNPSNLVFTMPCKGTLPAAATVHVNTGRRGALAPTGCGHMTAHRRFAVPLPAFAGSTVSRHELGIGVHLQPGKRGGRMNWDQIEG